MFDFRWAFKDFEIRCTHTYGSEEVPYLELVKWYEYNSKRYCFTLAYWYCDEDGGWELRFVCDRPFEYIADIDIATVWRQLFLAQQMFVDAMNKQ